jgi:hypothetical protein
MNLKDDEALKLIKANCWSLANINNQRELLFLTV